MELIIGGCFQGKTVYGMKKLEKKKLSGKKSQNQGITVVDGEECSWNQCAEADLVTHFHLLIRRALAQNDVMNGNSVETVLNDLTDQVNAVLQKNPDVMIVCDEVGYGIVPIERSDRDYREAVGRILCLLAKQAESVERVMAGIAVKIK